MTTKRRITIKLSSKFGNYFVSLTEPPLDCIQLFTLHSLTSCICVLNFVGIRSTKICSETLTDSLQTILNCNNLRRSCLKYPNMCTITDDKINAIGHVLQDTTRPLKERFRALFTLRNIGGLTSIKCIEECFSDTSALLKHELAYCLGQMGDKAAVPVLKSVLADITQEPMVRHEAAEALGAIGSEETMEFLKEFLNDPVVEVSETCELAIERIKWLKSDFKNSKPCGPYSSVDPAPPEEETNIQKLEKILLDENKPLFDRYRAMFALRNLQSAESVSVLSKGLFSKNSALFRHEIAFVLGQMQDTGSVPSLIKALEDSLENEMVRHECAEALGAIATKDCYEILEKYLKDEKRVVKESCEIALDMCDYENSPEFQYADTLVKV